MRDELADILKNVSGFEWDEGNIHKNYKKHNVTNQEAEQAFSNTPQILLEDTGHSQTETRYTLLGRTDEKRYLAVTFTIRRHKIRIISARDQKKTHERKIYQTLLVEEYE